MLLLPLLLAANLVLATHAKKHKHGKKGRIAHAKHVMHIHTQKSQSKATVGTSTVQDGRLFRNKSGAKQTYHVSVQFGNDTVQLMVDTGSADTFCVVESFQCNDAQDDPVGGLQACKFPKHRFCAVDQAKIVPNLQLKIKYADGETLLGWPVTDQLKLDTFYSRSERLNLVYEGLWNGDGVTSGILALGLGGTQNFEYRDKETLSPYLPFVKKTIAKLPEPVFAIAILYKEQTYAPQGYLTIGGVPDSLMVATYGYTACVPLVDSDGKKAVDPKKYTILLDKITLDGHEYLQNMVALVDSGTAFFVLPEATVNEMERQGQRDDRAQRPPKLSVHIGGVEFPVKADDWSEGPHKDPKNGKESPASFYVSNTMDPANPIILGASFFRSVLAVFDVGHNRMLFTSTNPIMGVPTHVVYDRCPNA